MERENNVTISSVSSYYDNKPMPKSETFIFKSNFEYKFVVVDPQTLGYTSISGYLLLCLNSPNIVSN